MTSPMNSHKSFATTASVRVFMLLSTMSCHAQLSQTFYDTACPSALATIRTSIRRAVSRERRMAASLIRLHFHDCFVQGCDASVLLDEDATSMSERTALANMGSARGYEVIDTAKSEVEKTCPGVVSCADILAVAARDASVAVGGLSWTLKLGRKDSTTASRDEANRDLPFFGSGLEQLVSDFARKGLSARDMVALSGAHTLGQAQCFTFRDRIYTEANTTDVGFASTRKRRYPSNGEDGNLAALDLVTPNSFDNNYFKNLIQKKGLLHSDQVLFSGGSTDNIVIEYSKSPSVFKSDFASAMIKMGDIGGGDGVIRRVCSSLN